MAKKNHLSLCHMQTSHLYQIKYSCDPTLAFVPSLLPQLYSVDIIWYYSANHNTYINTENHTARIHNYSIITKNTLYNDTIINYCYIEQCQ